MGCGSRRSRTIDRWLPGLSVIGPSADQNSGVEIRDRSAFYMALQSVRETDMDLTGWLEYFVMGLATQLEEVKVRGTVAIQADVLGHEHRLNKCQTAALHQVLQEGELSIQAYQNLFPNTSRRTLQRDLKALIAKEILASEGATNQLVYRLHVSE